MLIPRIGLVVLSQSNFDKRLAERLREKTAELLRNVPRIESFVYPSLVVTVEEVAPCIGYFRDNSVEAVVLVSGSFAPGDLTPAIARELGVPVLLWAVPEPLRNDRIVNTLSLCGANLNASTLWKLEHPYDFLLLDPFQTDAQSALSDRVAIIIAHHNLKHGRIGLVGHQAPGFYACGFDEFRLRRLVGTEVVQLGMATLFARMEDTREVSQGSLAQSAEEVLCPGTKIEVSKDRLRNSLLLYHVLSDWATARNLQGLAVRCWPEFPELRNEMPCAAIGWLTRSGVPASGEGDVLGAVTMLLAGILSGRSTFIADLLSVDSEANTMTFWHCGAAPCDLVASFCRPVLREHSRKPDMGTVNEFPLREGEVVVLRLSEGRIGYRLLTLKGESMPTDPGVRGNRVAIRFERPVERLMDGLVQWGFEHHYIVAYGDLYDKVAAWARMSGIPIFDGVSWSVSRSEGC